MRQILPQNWQNRSVLLAVTLYGFKIDFETSKRQTQFSTYVAKTCIASGFGTLNWGILVRMHHKRTHEEVKEVTVREFIYSELRLHSKQLTFRVWYSFPMVHKLGRLVHTWYSGLIFGVFFLLDVLLLQWLRNLHQFRASWPLTPWWGFIRFL